MRLQVVSKCKLCICRGRACIVFVVPAIESAYFGVVSCVDQFRMCVLDNVVTKNCESSQL